MGLTLDAELLYGNVAGARVIPGEPPEVGFTAHPHGGPEALWFCFRILADPPPERLRLVLDNHGNLLGGGSPNRLCPVVRRTGGEWERLGWGQAETLPDGRLQAVWELAAPGTAIEVAWCYPYGPPEVAALVGESAGYWRSAVIGVSQAGRPLERLWTGGPADPARPGVYLVARQHSGETPGSWLLDGLLRRLAERGSRLAVWAVPLSNIDGVVQGDYGKDNFPYDLNRAWGQPPMRHETLVIKRDIGLWASRCRPGLLIDCHAPGAGEVEGIYTYLPDPATRAEEAERLRPWNEAFQVALGELAAERFGRVVNYRSRWETPNFTRWANGAHGPAITFEVPYAAARGRLLTIADYREAGRRVADVVIDRLA